MTRPAGHGWSRGARRCALAAALSGALALPAAANAAPAFLDTIKALPDRPASCPIGCFQSLFADTAMDKNGDTIVAWVEPDTVPNRKLVVRYRPAGGAFGAP